MEKRIRSATVRSTARFHLNPSWKLYRPFFIRQALSDLSGLTEYLKEEKFDILNVHQSHDHILGGLAAKRSRAPVPVIRTDHKRDSIHPHFGNRLLLSRLTDGIITFSEKARRAVADHFGFPVQRVGKVHPALALERYPADKTYKDMKPVFGIGPDEVVIGMVARFQKYRRTEVFLEAVKSIVKEFPRIKVLLVGRSSQMGESVVEPMKRLGIEPWVVLGGYQTKDYLDTLACMDIFVFLMAGSDGTARALREAMAMGKPSIVADRGILPELVEDGVSGIVAEDSPGAFAGAALQLLRHPEQRLAMGRAAREKARREFRLDRQAEEVEGFYEEMLRLGKLNK